MTHCPNCGYELAPKPLPLTPVQLGALEFICRCIDRHGVPPNYREICDGIGAASTSTVHRLLCVLHRKGWIKRTPYEARGLEVLRYPNGAGDPI